MSGQGDVTRQGASVWRLLGCAAVLILAAGAVSAADREPAGGAERVTPSGMPVPRYVVLKFGEVNARAGPGDDHRLLWVYRVRDLPVQVVAETSEWRRICDPEGGMAWVHRRTTDGKQMVMNRSAAPVAVYRSREPGAHQVANLNPRSLASLLGCEGGWCRIKAGGLRGWAHADQLWGTAEAPQCR